MPGQLHLAGILHGKGTERIDLAGFDTGIGQRGANDLAGKFQLAGFEPFGELGLGYAGYCGLVLHGRFKLLLWSPPRGYLPGRARPWPSASGARARFPRRLRRPRPVSSISAGRVPRYNR